MASIVNNGPDSDAGAHRSAVEGTQERSRRLQRKTLPPQVLDHTRAAIQQKAGITDNRYPQAGYEVGHWVQPDERDTDMKMRTELIGTGNTTGGTPFGVMTAGQEVIDYLKAKKDQEEYWYELKLAGYLIDEKRPETQDNAFGIFPELREVPEQYHTQNLAMQEAIRTMLRDGKISGKEDNSLIAHIIREDYVLPIFPAWDPEGLIVGSEQLKPELLKLQYVNASKGIFSPRKWGVDAKAAMEDIQKKIKIMLLKRLYPGLRDQSDVDIFRSLIVRQSPLELTDKGAGMGISNDPKALWTYMSGAQTGPAAFAKAFAHASSSAAATYATAPAYFGSTP
jgi:hypothetical protein